MKTLSLIAIIGLVQLSSGNHEFLINVGVLKKLLSLEADLIDRLLDEIVHQQQHLNSISNDEVYAQELEGFSYEANEHSISTKMTISMLIDLENLWPEIDNYVKQTTIKIGLDEVTSLETTYITNDK
ncbi:uncharacterized protein LOC122498838 isoform X3 [Leptopilina heterotoma]|uniref:uncharacterized protein LOC122498838 isoform X3 n=1 Tax=Leptopilina heterotoma TaxID=63436 RepID=UPI001CA8F2D8|nr:uncharacterized protein LOC122498838 isoform X3 [Leptopilina heterotoma]